MSFYCPYCTHLQKALSGQNYCSNAGDNINSKKSNAFYLRSNEIYSGQHLSRLSIRGVLNGYQYYKTNQRESIVKSDNYLIMNEGESWYSEAVSESPIEMVVVAFNPDFLKESTYALTQPLGQLLDNPFESTNEELLFFENTYSNTPKIRELLGTLKNRILSGVDDEMLFDQIHFELLELIFQNHQDSLKEAHLLPFKKSSVQKELFQRLGLARDFMNANLSKNINLHDISKVSALSPYHFLRLFKALYKTTPHQYLIAERMKRASYLLHSSNKTIREVSFESGFENQSAFGRVFKNSFNCTPLQFRKRQL